MRAFTLTGPRTGDVRDMPDPRPGPGEAIIRTAFAGICGTDYRIFEGDFPSTYPFVNGHEFSGVIAALGANAGPWREGDRVTVDPTLSCGVCHHCRRGQANHCDRWGAIGDTRDGALAEFVSVPVPNLYRVEDHETLEEAALTEPLACVVWGIERLRVRPGDRALVVGAGPVGVLLTQMLSFSPVADVVAVDVSETKLAVARQLGARATFLSGPDLGAHLAERSSGRMFDIVVDCTGSPAVMEGLFAWAAPNARIMFFGVAPRDAAISIRPFDVYHRDWEILGSMAINGTFQQARDLLAAGRLEVKPLLTRVVGLDDVAGILGAPKGDDELKTLVRPGGD
ncbi:MAG TPA: alcohol dehydrogenase catalytic domain-containing protein [Vitreimonas sp.]|nr:alcohol dehydrogenase catalytic domain-containing protein [Vitreimonas sp.]